MLKNTMTMKKENYYKARYISKKLKECERLFKEDFGNMLGDGVALRLMYLDSVVYEEDCKSTVGDNMMIDDFMQYTIIDLMVEDDYYNDFIDEEDKKEDKSFLKPCLTIFLDWRE